MPLQLDMEPTFHVLVAATILCSLVWAIAPLSRHFVTKKTIELVTLTQEPITHECNAFGMDARHIEKRGVDDKKNIN